MEGDMRFSIFSTFNIFSIFMLLVMFQGIQLSEAIYSVNPSDSLQLVIKITRHGARTPGYLFPGDPNNNCWRDSSGQLTNEGKQQLYDIGKLFRSEYTGYLSELYKASEIKIWSSNIDRTVMSAQAFLAGLYPPKEDQVWNTNIPWQPIPVHMLEYDTISEGNSAMKDLLTICPTGIQDDLFFSQNKEIIELIQGSTNTYYNTCLDIQFFELLDTFIVEKFFKKSLPFGLDIHFEAINRLKDNMMVRLFTEPSLVNGFNAGLFGDIVQLLEAKYDNAITEKVHTYFMHDVNVLAFLSVLTTEPLTSPNFAASITIELHKTRAHRRDIYIIEIYHTESLGSSPRILNIKGCGHACPLEDFIELLRRASLLRSTSVCPCHKI